MIAGRSMTPSPRGMVAAFLLPLGAHVFPVHVLDSLAEPRDVVDRLGPAEPAIARVEADAHRLFVPQGVQQLGHAVDGVGHRAVGFQQ